MHRILMIFSFIILLSSTANANRRSATDVQIYDLSDLKVLKNESSYQEFFQHAKDIKPAKRDKTWNTLVRSMAMEMLQDKMSDIKISEKDFKTVLSISSWPALKTNEFYLRKRDQFAYKYFQECFKTKNINSCYSEINKYYNQFSLSPELGVKFAKILNKHFDSTQNITYDLWPLLKPMAQNSISEFYCNKSPMRNIIVNKLYNDSKFTKKAQNKLKIHPDCLKAITPDLKKNLFTTGNSYLRYKTFSVLQDKNILSKDDIFLYYTLQLLDAHIFDKQQTIRAFQSLKSLANDYRKRELVLLKLKAITPLPGKVFTLDTKSSIVITRGISKYLPEYIDYYSTTCLKHLEGTMKTIGGNPATYCHDLFNMAKSSNLLPIYKANQYKKIMNSWKL
jgi:hypothetical protein